MKLTGLLCALILAAGTASAADVPAGYRLLYTSDYSRPDSIKAYTFSDPAAWRLGNSGHDGYLEQFQKSDYEYEVRSPFNIGLLKRQKFGDFILQGELMQTSKDYGHRDMCLFFGFQDRSHFYYVHLSSQSDDHAHQVFIVNGRPRTKISTKTTSGIDWGREAWRKVRLERKVSDGTIRVFFENMDEPIMTAMDNTFGEGFLGFGTFDDTGRVRNVKIWGPGSSLVEEAPELFLNQAKAKPNGE